MAETGSDDPPLKRRRRESDAQDRVDSPSPGQSSHMTQGDTCPPLCVSPGGSHHLYEFQPGFAHSQTASAYVSPSKPESPDSVHDLPYDLLHAGWRRFWSKRENRFYLFNKSTKESRWELPGITETEESGKTAIAHLPPRACLSSALKLSGPRDDALSAQICQKKSREHSAGLSPPQVSFDYSPYWDFKIPTNAMMFERKTSGLLPPHPEVEQLRADLMAKLRQHYQELCHTREGIDAPKNSFNRWLFEIKVRDKGHDPVLPCQRDPDVSLSMYREILKDIPIKLVEAKSASYARRQLFKYAEASKKMIETRGTSSDSRKIVKWSAEETFDWLRKQDTAPLEEYLERLEHLKKQCQHHLTEAAKASVEEICKKIYHIFCEHVDIINKRHWQVLKENNIQPLPPGPDLQHRKIKCHPAQMALPSPRMPEIQHWSEGEMTVLSFKGEPFKINSSHFYKLNQLYNLSCRDDSTFELFLGRTWCLFRRYQTLFGPKINEGHGLQGALPVHVFDCLHRVFGVTFECFASPLNCYFKQYCSAFLDTDGFYGSLGPLLDFHPTTGSFQANPPFCEELMEAMTEHFERLLSESNEPLSFIVFIPEWRNPPTKALVRLESSRFKREQITLHSQEHEYRNGFQHVCTRAEMDYKAVHGTLVVFLQNSPGLDKWGPTPERIKELNVCLKTTDSATTPPS